MEKTVIVVDDEQDVLLAIELALVEDGFRVVLGGNGREALARLAEVRDPIVLMDVMMPVLGGLEALRLIKADPDYRAIPVVMMSAVVPKVAPGEFPWDAFLRKPFEIDELLKVVHHFSDKERQNGHSQS